MCLLHVLHMHSLHNSLYTNSTLHLLPPDVGDTIYKTWTQDSGLDCGPDSGLNNRLNIGLEFWLPWVKLLSSKVLTLLDVVSSSSVCCRDNEIGTNLVSYPDPSLGTRLVPIYITAKRDVILTIIILFFTRVATVNMVLWEDTRIVPCDSQLWAIPCTWSSYRNNRICYTSAGKIFLTSDKCYMQQKGIVPSQRFK